VPFLVRTPGSEAVRISADAKASFSALHGGRDEAPQKLLVKAGQKAVLIWEADGIRSATAVLCLDRGGKGERVRVRALKNGSVLTATVIAERTLQQQP
jgi:hypothetical protein